MKNFARIFSTHRADALGGYEPRPVAENVNTPALIPIPEVSLTTDYGNGVRFINDNKDKAHFIPELKIWVIWNDKLWESDDCNKMRSLGIETVLKIAVEASATTDPEKQLELKAWCKTSQTTSKIKGMIDHAEPKMSMKWERFDTNAMLLNVDNGVIDLRTGQLLPHSPSYMITKIAPVRYVEGADCPTLKRFLASAFPDNEEMVHYFHKMAGYALTADTREKCFFIFYGPGGDNGKTVLINMFRHILGPYAMQTPMDTLLSKKPGGNSNDIVRLKGARFVAASEVDKNHRYRFNESLLKRLSGDDPVSARKLFEEFIEYYPEFKLFIGTNHIPELTTTDRALQNRVKIIRFNMSFPDGHEERIENLLASLKAEAPGILNWLIEGCLLWQSEGLGAVPDRVDTELPNTVRDATIDRFLHECCDFQDGFVQKCGVLHDTYKDWCSALNIVPVGNAKFSRHLTDKHALMNDKIGSTGFHWFGITLKEALTDTVAA